MIKLKLNAQELSLVIAGLRELRFKVGFAVFAKLNTVKADIEFEISPEDLNIVGHGLEELPLKHSIKLILRLRDINIKHHFEQQNKSKQNVQEQEEKPKGE